MGKDEARQFVEKMFSDDDFLREICRHGGFKEKASDAEKTALIMNAASAMGFNFNADEYTKANEEYFAGKGAFGAIKAFWRLNKVIKSENKKNK